MERYPEYMPFKTTPYQAAWLRSIGGPNMKISPVVRACILIAQRHEDEVINLLRTEKL